MHWLSPLFYMEVEVAPLRKKMKKWTSIEIKIFITAGYIRFDHERNE